jgi:hypothetical protein
MSDTRLVHAVYGALGARSGAAHELEFYGEPQAWHIDLESPDGPQWLTDLIKATCEWAGYGSELIDPSLERARALDRLDPARICGWCYHPRNSDECQFAAKHVPYREMFA